MPTTSLAPEQTNQFSPLFLDYVNGSDNLKPFYGNKPSMESFREQIKLKRTDEVTRRTLVKTLEGQYKHTEISSLQKRNLEKLHMQETFTITTGHQLCLATGPLYFLYKILTTIRLCEELQKEFPGNNFVPVFWMATEDHDIEEINNFNLFGKEYKWDTTEKGPSGRISTSGLKEFFGGIKDIPVWLSEAYSDSDTLAEATRKIVQYLFAEKGLIAIDADDAELKKLFAKVIENDVVHNKYAPIVRETSERLQKHGYKVQAFVRDINHFYLQNQSRERIERDTESFRVINNVNNLSLSEITETIHAHPEKFSPNVILRPLYQEVILPNLAYIGGPGELAYWLQLKDVFDSEQVPFPILFPRKFATLVPKNLAEKLEQSQLEPKNLFLDEKDFFELLIEKLKVEKLDFSEEEKTIAALQEILNQKANKADKSFLPAIDAEISKINKSVSELGKRLSKALENRHETDIAKLQNLKKKLFPNGELQERHDNFLNFYINNPQIIEILYQSFDPFHLEMEIIHI